MKRLYTLFLVTIVFAPVFSQNIEIHQNGVIVSDTQVIIDSAATCDHIAGDFYIVNTSGAPISIKWSRTRVAHMSPYWDQVCDDILCFDAADATVYTRPANFTIATGDSSVLQPKIYPVGTAGCAIYTYKIYSGLGTYQDSVQVKYRFGGQDCFLTIPETPINYSVYPNPVSNLLNVNITANGNNVQINIYNIMGEVVLKEILTEGVNSLSLANLTNGVYFYSILKNNEIVETKKLIVRH